MISMYFFENPLHSCNICGIMKAVYHSVYCSGSLKGSIFHGCNNIPDFFCLSSDFLSGGRHLFYRTICPAPAAIPADFCNRHARFPIYLDTSSKALFHTVGVFELVLLIGAIAFSISDRVKRQKGTADADEADAEEPAQEEADTDAESGHTDSEEKA